MGIEPTSAAWEAAILPLNHARSGLPYQSYRDFGKSALERFRLPKAISDAQRGAALMELSNQVYASLCESDAYKSCYAVPLFSRLRDIREGRRGL